MTTLNLDIVRGKTFKKVIRWEVAPYLYKAISAIPKSAPATITCVGHGIPNGWRVAPVSVKGMVEINAPKGGTVPKDYTPATVIDANTVQLNEINAADFTQYSGGGYLKMLSPKDLTGFTARMAIKDKAGTEILRLTTENGGILIDTAEYTVTLVIDADATAALPGKGGVYDLEMVSSTGEVSELLAGKVSFGTEVTT